MQINKKLAKMWSRIGPRAVYGKIMSEIALANEDVLLMSADLGRSSGLASFYQEYPERFVNVGIAEQNMIGVAAGLTRLDYDTFASTFAPFASMRAAEQVRMNMGYMEEPVKLVALGSGLSMGFLGNSHFGLEDVAVMKTIHNLTIISPADCVELYKALNAVVGYKKPVYIRLTGGINSPVVYEDDYDFEIGKPIWILPKSDINVFATGTTVGQAKKAIEKLNEEGFKIGLLNIHTIKPFDDSLVVNILMDTKQLFIFEEHTRVGGLRSSIYDVLVDNNIKGIEVVSHTLPDSYLETGEYDYLINRYELDAIGIENKIRGNIQ
ncbi:1-deoxy-D-xylulose-5-phosphate synthase [Marinomonas spartinae]|uniref:transketolase family protein n=1 Tax=Marinomonas spartinae TaxID=1792290 RepID=UPI000808E1B4|nr:transketolase C-terminal domain-containing protein [Marinomonas spartinae]SBS40434.1 1-deoxy-D-xylulose-5-phosphate synthase [Marinomonas spartinae]